MDTYRQLLSLTTATLENALTKEERDEFLGRQLVGRLATNREDGWWHVTLCVDIDPRLDGPSQAPRAVVCFGRAELLEDEVSVRTITEKLEIHYIGAILPELHEAIWFQGRTAVAITPVRWLTWDQGKCR